MMASLRTGSVSYKQPSASHYEIKQNNVDTSILELEADCPLCMEELDISDRTFHPCECGYQICRFCWHHIKETLNGRCPACRREYSEEAVQFTPMSADDIAKLKQLKKHKDSQKKDQEVNPRRHLSNMRVVQKNLVYVIGIPLNVASEDILGSFEYFGQYGKIIKIVTNKKNLFNTNAPQGPSVSCYVTFRLREDAGRAIQAVDGITFEGRVLRASYGTTKYCSFFLRNLACTNQECMYLHEVGEKAESFTKEEMTTSKHQFAPHNLSRKPQTAHWPSTSQSTTAPTVHIRSTVLPPPTVPPHETNSQGSSSADELEERDAPRDDKTGKDTITDDGGLQSEEREETDREAEEERDKSRRAPKDNGRRRKKRDDNAPLPDPHPTGKRSGTAVAIDEPKKEDVDDLLSSMLSSALSQALSSKTTTVPNVAWPMAADVGSRETGLVPPAEGRGALLPKQQQPSADVDPLLSSHPSTIEQQTLGLGSRPAVAPASYVIPPPDMSCLSAALDPFLPATLSSTPLGLMSMLDPLSSSFWAATSSVYEDQFRDPAIMAIKVKHNEQQPPGRVPVAPPAASYVAPPPGLDMHWHPMAAPTAPPGIEPWLPNNNSTSTSTNTTASTHSSHHHGSHGHLPSRGKSPSPVHAVQEQRSLTHKTNGSHVGAPPGLVDEKTVTILTKETDRSAAGIDRRHTKGSRVDSHDGVGESDKGNADYRSVSKKPSGSSFLSALPRSSMYLPPVPATPVISGKGQGSFSGGNLPAGTKYRTASASSSSASSVAASSGSVSSATAASASSGGSTSATGASSHYFGHREGRHSSRRMSSNTGNSQKNFFLDESTGRNFDVRKK